MIRLRLQVSAFAQMMERKLRKNDDKGGWRNASKSFLLRRLLEETVELAELFRLDEGTITLIRIAAERVSRFAPQLCSGVTMEQISNEAADVANFAMMLVDVCGGFDERAQEKEATHAAGRGEDRAQDAAAGIPSRRA